MAERHDDRAGSPRFALIALLPMLAAATLLAAVTPPFQSPDENDHIKRAYLLSRGQITLATPPGQSSGGYIDRGLADYMAIHEVLPHNPQRRLSAGERSAAAEITWAGDAVFSPAPGTGYYFPAIYLPQAAALWLGRSLDLGVDASYRLARVFAQIAAAALFFIAFLVWRPPAIVLGLLYLPMFLFQFASASIDPIATALFALSISVFLRGLRRDDPRPAMAALAPLLFVVVSCRIQLAAAVLMFLGLARRGAWRTGVALALAVLLLLFGWIAVSLSGTVDLRVETGAGPATLALRYLSMPGELFRVLWNTVSDPGLQSFYLRSFVGVLGWLDAHLPFQTLQVMVLMLALILLAGIRSGSARPTGVAVPVLALSAFGSALLVLLALLVTWTPYPATTVLGVQGRYFLPSALLLGYLMPPLGGSGRMWKIQIVLLAALAGLALLAARQLLRFRYGT